MNNSHTPSFDPLVLIQPTVGLAAVLLAAVVSFHNVPTDHPRLVITFLGKAIEA